MAIEVVGIDPGPTMCGFVRWDGVRASTPSEIKTENVLRWARIWCDVDIVAVEMIEHMGMPAGREVFETAFAIGRLQEILGDKFVPVYRSKVKLYFCGSSKAKDANVRQALLDRYGPVSTYESYVPIGKKGQPLKARQRVVPGPLYEVSGHAWSALAIAAYAWEVEVNK